MGRQYDDGFCFKKGRLLYVTPRAKVRVWATQRRIAERESAFGISLSQTSPPRVKHRTAVYTLC